MGIDITESDFKRYNLKEQNVVIFKNLKEVKEIIDSFQQSNLCDHRKIRGVSVKALLVASGAMGLSIILLGFLFQFILGR